MIYLTKKDKITLKDSSGAEISIKESNVTDPDNLLQPDENYLIVVHVSETNMSHVYPLIHISKNHEGLISKITINQLPVYTCSGGSLEVQEGEVISKDLDIEYVFSRYAVQDNKLTNSLIIE